ncbi:MAG: class I SAM-dependent methyltransferase [Actinomycetota bacterium]|nr:class I SAM-dependent methyltransferase [Actinomycetota bacterium]
MADDPVDGPAEHWDGRYSAIGDTAVAWFEADPATSLELISSVAGPEASVVDVGGGASRLVDRLLERGHRDITVVDLSQQALASSVERVGSAPVDWLAVDVRDWQPLRTFDVWHDRAAYHFLTDPADQERYWDLAHQAVADGGHVVIATFAEDGPEQCSGLPVARYSAASLAAAMGERFAVVASRRQEHVTPSGATQVFTWAVATRR